MSDHQRYEGVIYSRIHEAVRDAVAAGKPLLVDSIVAEIIEEIAAPKGADAEFYLLCAQDQIKQAVRQALSSVSKIDQLGAENNGFNHLQKAYSVERDGRRVLVPVWELTAKEMSGRIAQYERMAESLRRHAMELKVCSIALHPKQSEPRSCTISRLRESANAQLAHADALEAEGLSQRAAA